mgnify:CR=1 FL=1
MAPENFFNIEGSDGGVHRELAPGKMSITTMQAGADGMVVMDIFAPPRKAYEKAGKGFATEEA